MNDEMCNFYIMYFYDSKKYSQEPPGMCRWGNLDDNLKFPKGSDQLDSKAQNGEFFNSYFALFRQFSLIFSILVC